MEISDFTFETRQVVPNVFETTLTNKQGSRYGCTYKAPQPLANENVFDAFKKDFKNIFFIDVSGEVVL